MFSDTSIEGLGIDDLPLYRCGNIFAIPITHYSMEMSSEVLRVFHRLKPDCVAVELAETMTLQLQHAASRLPDISVVVSYTKDHNPIYYMSEPCDAAFEGLRCALESGIPAFCVDLDVDAYPDIREPVPDPYAISKIGLKQYYEVYREAARQRQGMVTSLDLDRELHMARRLKELSFSHDRILFIVGMAHLEGVMTALTNKSFPKIAHAEREVVQLCTLTEESAREVMAECGWMSTKYEHFRNEYISTLKKPEQAEPIDSLDRQKLIYDLYKTSTESYMEACGHAFPGYHMRNLMKFMRNYALVSGKLMPDLFQILSAAKCCVDHNYAYEVWNLATSYSYRKNIDGLPELDLTIQDIWGHSKLIRFHLTVPGRKAGLSFQKRPDKSKYKFQPPGFFGICSYPPEDLIIENFGNFLKKKGVQLLSEEGARVIPFVTSIEDGIDTRETIRHWHEKKLYIKVRGKPPGGVGSVVMIFNPEDEEKPVQQEKYAWKATWLGEHNQESDMAFYATPLTENVVGPGISRCEYGGFMMSYPPRRMRDVWNDPDYDVCRNKAETLLMAAIDYSIKPLIVYVAAKPPRSAIKSFARRYGKKIVYIPLGQLSPITVNKIRIFHVLDNHQKRGIAGEYIY